jgi:hypothetical protein
MRQVPLVDVEEAIRQACRRWRVLEIPADPFRIGNAVGGVHRRG